VYVDFNKIDDVSFRITYLGYIITFFNLIVYTIS